MRKVRRSEVTSPGPRVDPLRLPAPSEEQKGGNTGPALRPAKPVLARRTRPIVQLSGLFRKQIVELTRQRRLLLVLVAGPFLVLFLFAVGYDQHQVVLRTTFVGPEGSMYEASVDRFADELSDYVEVAGFTSDLVSAEKRLRAGEIDLVIIFPADPAASVLAGEQAAIGVLHNKLDPIQQTAVEVSAHVAVQELNSNILERIVTEAQQTLVPYDDGLERLLTLLGRLESASDSADEETFDQLAVELESTAAGMSEIVDISQNVARELRGEATPGQQAELEALAASLRDLQQSVSRLGDSSAQVSAADISQTRGLVEAVRENGDAVTTLEPQVAVRPFTSDTASLLREPVDVDDFFAPAAIALLLQHMVLTFAAMSMVADRSLGLFEIYRVGPIGAGRILAGKYLAFMLLGAGIGALLITLVVVGLDVPMRGSIGWVATGLVGLLAASIGLGMLLSLVASTDTQAVQYSMLALLAGLFFGGFLLDLDALRYPVRALSWLLPVTYGVRLLRDVMLRGIDPSTADLVGLAVTSFVFGSVAWALLARQLRVR